MKNQRDDDTGKPNILSRMIKGLYDGCLGLISGVILMILPFLLIVIFFAAIAVPNFTKARNNAQRNACISNMRQLQEAKDMVALKKGYGTKRSVSEQEVSEYIKGGFSKLACPKSRLPYIINTIGQNPSCSVHGPMDKAIAEVAAVAVARAKADEKAKAKEEVIAKAEAKAEAKAKAKAERRR